MLASAEEAQSQWRVLYTVFEVTNHSTSTTLLSKLSLLPHRWCGGTPQNKDHSLKWLQTRSCNVEANQINGGTDGVCLICETDAVCDSQVWTTSAHSLLHKHTQVPLSIIYTLYGLCFIKRKSRFCVSSSSPLCFIASSNTDALFSSSSFFTSVFFPPREFILYSIQSGLLTPCYDNGRELSMFNERLEATYRFRHILVYVNIRSSSIISSHITVFQGELC